MWLAHPLLFSHAVSGDHCYEDSAVIALIGPTKLDLDVPDYDPPAMIELALLLENGDIDCDDGEARAVGPLCCCRKEPPHLPPKTGP